MDNYLCNDKCNCKKHKELIKRIEKIQRENAKYEETYLKQKDVALNYYELVQQNEKLKKENDGLVAEVERLKKLVNIDNETAIDMLLELAYKNDEIERLKEALKKCNPWLMDAEQDCPKCNYAHGESYCSQCGNIAEEDHKEDCLYVKLTK